MCPKPPKWKKILDSSKIFILEENVFLYTKDNFTLLIIEQRILLANFSECFGKKNTSGEVFMLLYKNIS